MEFKFVKIVAFVDAEHGDAVRKALADAECGHIGNYDCCSFTVCGVGRFRGLDGSRPFIGKAGKIEEVHEERIETICPTAKLDKAMKAIKAAHPYEEPAIDVYPLLTNGQI